MITLKVDRNSGVAPYRQLVDQLRSAIMTGRLGPGQPLPSVRDVARASGVNPLTIGKAYAQLEDEKWITTHWGKGSFVAEKLPGALNRPEKRLEKLVEKFIQEATPLATDSASLLALLEKKLAPYVKK